MQDRPKSSVCSLCLKLATVGDKITLSEREFHTFTTRLEKKWPSPADRAVEFLKLHVIYNVSMYQYVASVSSPAEEQLRSAVMRSPHYNPLSIPVSDVDQSVQVKVGIMLQKIIQVVRNRSLEPTMR